MKNKKVIRCEKVPAAFKGIKLVWQVSHSRDGFGKIERTFFKTKKEAMDFAQLETTLPAYYNEVSICWYEAIHAIYRDGKVIGHKYGDK